MQGTYLFEAKGIQRYLLDSGRLKDVIGASESVAKLASSDGNDLLQLVLDACGLDGGQIAFSRRASAAFLAHGDPADLATLRVTWRLVVQLALPGLEFSDALVSENAETKGLAALKREAYRSGSGVRENGTAALLPLGTPFHIFVPRTGRIATNTRKTGEKTDGSWEMEPLDQLVWSQHLVFRALRQSDETVAQRFLDRSRDDRSRDYVFPRNLEPGSGEVTSQGNPSFPFRDGINWIALVHADVSGLGQLWRSLTEVEANEEARGNLVDPGVMLKISRRIEEALECAAKAATAAVLLPEAATDKRFPEIAILPARPLVLGGDDLTVIVRSDLALRFTLSLLTEIERETADAFKKLKADEALTSLASVLPDCLTACAGIAFARASQPFQMTSALAEALCKFAKADAKGLKADPVPSALAYHIVSTTLQEDYKDEIVTTELTLPDGRLLTAQPVYVSERDGRVTGAALDRLVEVLDKAEKGRGKLRSLRPTLFADPAGANRDWVRWREVAKSSGINIDTLDEALRGLGCEPGDRVPFRQSDPPVTPLFDALELIDLGHRPVKATGGIK